MKKRFFRFITYVVVFLCLYNNAVPAADSLQPNSAFINDPANNVDARDKVMGMVLRNKIVVSKCEVSSDVITVWDGKSDLTQLLKDADIVMLGAPDSTGTKRNLGFGGSEEAPDVVIEELLKRDLSRLKGLKVVYLGNIKIPKTDRITRVTRKDGQEVSFPDALLETYGNIKSVVSCVLKINPNIHILQIGGDHGNAYPFNAPFGRLGFINVDAHFDTRDPKDPTRPEGPNSGTPFRYLLEEGHTPPRNAAFLGIDNDNPYAARLEEWVRSVGVENIVPYQEVMRRWKEDRANFAQFIDELLEKVVLGVDTGHISFCIDVVNEDEAPGCSARNKNGLTSEVVRFIAGRAGMNKKFRSIGVFEIIPELDTDNKTIRLGADIIVEYFTGAMGMAGNGKRFLAGVHDRRLPKLEELQFIGQGVMLDRDIVTALAAGFSIGNIDKWDINSISKMLFKGEDDGSDSFCDLLRKSFIKLMIRLMGNDKLAGVFFKDILGTEANQGKNICIRIAKDMPVNSSRYYDKDNDLVVIVLDSRFVEALLEYFKKSGSSFAIEWMLAERVFIHELSHNNEVNSLKEEMEEEAKVIGSRDLVFFRELCFKDKHLMREITQFRSKDGVSKATKSGEYFRLLAEMCVLMEEEGFPKQYITARIKEYAFRNIFRDMTILEWIKIIGKGLEGLTISEIKDRVKNIREIIDGEWAGSLITAEALVLFKEATRRTLNITIHDEQILGAIAISEGKAVEMLTGEGKTLTIAMAGFLQSLFGKGVHIATFNDYLAKRDMLWMGEIFDLLGVTVGLRMDRGVSYIYSKKRIKNRANLRRVPKKQAYRTDIIYGSGNVFVFDFEEDSVVLDPRQKAQGELNFAIVDEGDSILVDEALIPLTLSVKMRQGLRKYIYYDMARFVKDLVEGADYTVDVKNRLVMPNKGVLYNFGRYKELRKRYSKVPDVVFENCLMQALRAKELVHLDEDYIIEDGRLVIIDEFTGRPRYGYVWGEGLHQAVEAKEGLIDITDFSRNLNSMTKFGYFRMYKKLSCASGTLRGVREVLSRLYKLETVGVPPNKPVVREEYPGLHFDTKLGKFTAVVNEAKEMRDKGRPVLIGTKTIKDSELLSRLLSSKNIPHRVLNGKNLKEEAGIVSEAGKASDGKGNVTVVTNLAGRGTDIILGAGVNEEGGLHIIGTEHHESIRVDNQLRGRAGRQGDNGSCRFFSSEEDYIIRRFRGKDDNSRPLNVILKRSWMASKDNLLFKSQLDNIYSSYQNRFFEFRNRLLDLDILTKKDVSELFGLLEDTEDAAGCYEAAKGILDEVLIVEDAIFSQILKRKRLVRSADSGDKERLLEMLDLGYEVFIFRMQTLMEKLRSDGLTEEEILRLFRKAGRWIFSKFIEDVHRDIRESEMYNNPLSLERLTSLPISDNPAKRVKVIDASCLFYWDNEEGSLKLKARGFKEALRQLKRRARKTGIQIEFLIVNIDRDIGKSGINEMRRVLGISQNERLVYFKDITHKGTRGVNLKVNLLDEINNYREDNVTGKDLTIAYMDAGIHKDVFSRVEEARYITVAEPDTAKEIISGHGLIWALMLENPGFLSQFPDETRKELGRLGVDRLDDILRVRAVPLTEYLEVQEEAMTSA